MAKLLDAILEGQPEMTTAIITAIYGGYDYLSELPDGHGFDEAICVTDNPDLQPDTWTIVYKPKPDLHPRLAAKYPKMTPWLYTDADVAVWLDGSAKIIDSGFKQACLDALGEEDIVVWKHPERNQRNCLYDEATYCAGWPKYRDWPIGKQVAHYEDQGMPRGFGLYACGTIVWRKTPQAHEFGLNWLQENLAWSIQDQVSLPYLVWKHKPRLATFPFEEYGNPYLVWFSHTRND